MSNKKIAVFTGTRAEYGLLYWILKGISASKHAELQLLVGGMHLSSEFGYTVNQIEKDGFDITDKLEFLLSSDSPVGISKSLGLAVISAAESFARNKPDVVVILGDRFEALAIAQAAMIAAIPIAHIHGGEITQGVIDDSVRHAITKMSYLHFTSTEIYRKRVIQLGEQPQNVFNMGAPGIDNINKLTLMELDELASSLQIQLSHPFFLITYHPVTLLADKADEELKCLLSALDKFPQYQVIFTYPNADTYGRNLIEILKAYQQINPKRTFLLESMGQLRYLSAMKLASLVIGNSSSGIIEAPSCKVATVNIGDRQKGRLSAESVIHCKGDESSIYQAIQYALSEKIQSTLDHVINPYGNGQASEKIVQQLVDCELVQHTQKVFYDLN
ncbi:UDP-N-acetylglucosamine 2-epimerase [Colwellia sp. RE-S-Sl-9]